MSDEARSLDNLEGRLDDADAASNSVPVPREPPPSLGMVAHIWAGHLGPVETEPAGVVGLDPEAPPADEATITLPSPRAEAATVD
jgi:hypothetical protein